MPQVPPLNTAHMEARKKYAEIFQGSCGCVPVGVPVGLWWLDNCGATLQRVEGASPSLML